MARGFGILDLLGLRGFDPTVPGKLVRHQDTRFDFGSMVRRGLLETYQKYQGRPVFRHCEHIVSFVGAGGTKAKFYGVYRVGAELSGDDMPPPSEAAREVTAGAKYHYDLARDPGYADLRGRVVIEWGKAALSWHQRLTNKQVLEILPAGQIRPAFDDYLGFVVSFDELVGICAKPEAHRDWQSRLSAVAGVYLIVATTTGAQYVGSASGDAGVWGRWEQYARTGHGGNKLLRELMECDPDYPSAFAFSLLHVLPKTMARSEVRAWEQLHKEKLGREAVSLNAN